MSKPLKLKRFFDVTVEEAQKKIRLLGLSDESNYSKMLLIAFMEILKKEFPLTTCIQNDEFAQVVKFDWDSNIDLVTLSIDGDKKAVFYGNKFDANNITGSIIIKLTIDTTRYMFNDNVLENTETIQAFIAATSLAMPCLRDMLAASISRFEKSQALKNLPVCDLCHVTLSNKNSMLFRTVVLKKDDYTYTKEIIISADYTFTPAKINFIGFMNDCHVGVPDVGYLFQSGEISHVVSESSMKIIDGCQATANINDSEVAHLIHTLCYEKYNLLSPIEKILNF